MSFRITNARTAFFSSKEEYLAYQASWKARAQAKNLTAVDFLVHALLTGKDVYRAFSPLTPAKRHGQAPYTTLANLVYWLAPEAGTQSAPHARLAEFLKQHRQQLRAEHPAIGEGHALELVVELAGALAQ